MRLITKVLLFGVVLIAVPLLIALWASRAGVARTLEAEARRTLESQTALLEAAARPDMERPDAPDLQATLVRLATHELRYTVIAADGRVIADSSKDPAGMENHADRDEVLEANQSGIGFARRPSETLGVDMAYVARAVHDGEDRIVGYARAALPLRTLTAREQSLNDWIFRAFLLAWLIGSLLALVFARRFVARIAAMCDAGAAIARGETARRVAVLGHDELGELGQSLNAMAAHFEEQVDTLQGERQRLDAILAGMIEGVVAVNREEQIVHANDAAGRILGFVPADGIGRPVWEHVRLVRVPEALREAIEQRRPQEDEVTDAREGELRSLRVLAAPLLGRDADGPTEARGAVAVVRDVTQLRRLERVRRDFVANASHELKTPVAAIRGLVETILDDPDMTPETRSGFLERVHVQAGRLQGLVEEMLDLSRYESEEGAWSRNAIDACGIVAEAVDLVAPLAAERGIDLSHHAADEAMLVRGHPEALRRITVNLLDNAVKYAPVRGRVDVSLRLVDERVVLRVDDNGQGVPQAERQRVFERFYRVDSGRAREAGGSGLGLAIVKHLVLSLGGDVHIATSESGGARFEVALPSASG